MDVVGIGRGDEFTDVLHGVALVEGVGVWVVDLNAHDLRLDAAAFGHEAPAFLVETAGAVALDGAGVFEGEGAAVVHGADPLGGESEAEGRVWDGGDEDAFKHLLAAAVANDGGAAVFLCCCVAGQSERVCGCEQKSEVVKGGGKTHGGTFAGQVEVYACGVCAVMRTCWRIRCVCGCR